MDIKEYLQIIRKRLRMILIITLTSTLVSAGVSYFIIKPIYKSDISVIIGRVSNSTDTGGNQAISYDQVIMYQRMVKTYIELAKSRTVTENTIKSLKLDIKPEVLQNMISVSPRGDTEFLTISVKSKNAEQAMLIANQLALSLKEVSIEVKKMDNVQILDPAELPTVPDSPKPLLSMIISFLLGLMISIGLAFLLYYMDNTVRTKEDIEKLLGIPVIGLIPYESEIK